MVTTPSYQGLVETIIKSLGVQATSWTLGNLVSPDSLLPFGFGKTNKQTNNTQSNNQSMKHTNIQAYKQSNKQANNQTNKQTNKQTNRHTNTQSNNQSMKHTNIQTYKHEARKNKVPGGHSGACAHHRLQRQPGLHRAGTVHLGWKHPTRLGANFQFLFFPFSFCYVGMSFLRVRFLFGVGFEG